MPKGTLLPAVCDMPPPTWTTMFKIKSKLINWSNSKNRDKLVAAFEEWNKNSESCANFTKKKQSMTIFVIPFITLKSYIQ